MPSSRPDLISNPKPLKALEASNEYRKSAAAEIIYDRAERKRTASSTFHKPGIFDFPEDDDEEKPSPKKVHKACQYSVLKILRLSIEFEMGQKLLIGQQKPKVASESKTALAAPVAPTAEPKPSFMTSSERAQGISSFGHRKEVDTGATSDHDSDDCVPKELKKKRNARPKSFSGTSRTKSPKGSTATEEGVRESLSPSLVGYTERRKLPNASKPDYSLAPRLPSTQSTTRNSQSPEPTPQRTSTSSLFLSQQPEDSASLSPPELPIAQETSNTERQITPPPKGLGLPESSKPKSPPSLGKSVLDPARKKRLPPLSSLKTVNDSSSNIANNIFKRCMTTSGTSILESIVQRNDIIIIARN